MYSNRFFPHPHYTRRNWRLYSKEIVADSHHNNQKLDVDHWCTVQSIRSIDALSKCSEEHTIRCYLQTMDMLLKC